MKDFIYLTNQLKGLSISEEDYEVLEARMTVLENLRVSVDEAQLNECNMALTNIPNGGEII
ncbi:hypothetical protein [Bacillus massiliglaciei]|uniref:hypothetical protein n=1 Tax=Bacillus massiliglaciei TaxID=1816693 RepID=UPI000DA63FCE|nr:hypothetical protein [Bacillus massiliglaciei]